MIATETIQESFATIPTDQLMQLTANATASAIRVEILEQEVRKLEATIEYLRKELDDK